MKKLLLITITTTALTTPLAHGFREMQNNIGITAVACGTDELLVDAGGWKFKASDFINKGFKPVRVQVANQSDQVVSISDHSVQFSDSDIRALTEQLKCHENLRPLAYLIVTQSICWTAIGAAIIGGFGGALFSNSRRRNDPGTALFVASIVGGLGAGLASFISFVRTPFYWMNLREANRKLHGIVMEALHMGHIIIPPHQTAEKIILIPLGYQRVFSFEVMNEGDGNTAAKFYVDVRLMQS